MGYDPNNYSVDEVNAKLEKASASERDAILKAEQGGKKRKGILEPAGLDPEARVDASGRSLYPWETSPDEHVYAVVVDDDPEVEAARKAQQEQDELIAAAQGGQGGDQGGVTGPGVGTAPEAPAAPGGDAGLTTV